MSVNLVVGCGYLGLRVARRWQDAGQRVVAITRSAERAEELHHQGIEPLVADVTRTETLGNLPVAKTVLYCVGYDRHAKDSRWDIQVEGLRNVLDALSMATGRILYVSSTGVYGNAGGDWVNEESPCRPAARRERLCSQPRRLSAAIHWAIERLSSDWQGCMVLAGFLAWQIWWPAGP